MSKEAVLVVHNEYKEPGGEDAAFEAEAGLLERFGHRVIRHRSTNAELDAMGPVERTRVTLWNHEAYERLEALARREKPAVVHFHNTFPLLSPAVHWAAKRSGARVVLSLHNYRLVCPGSLLLRDRRPCEDCVGSSFAWRGVAHRCYRDSAVASAGAAAAVAFHRLRRTWRDAVDAFVALSGFARSRFVAGGLPEHRIHVKPNFVHPDPGTGQHESAYALFVGRLSEQKGVRVLLEAWRRLDGDMGLKIVGDGPLEARVVKAVRGRENAEWLGRRSREEVLGLMRRARFLVFPSISYENCPMVILEAFATGLPVVTSGIGSMAEMVQDGVTGLHVRPSSPHDLAVRIRQAWHDEVAISGMSKAARHAFEARYTADANYRQILDIYRGAPAARDG